MNVQMRVHTQNIRSSSTRSHASEEENRTRNQQENLQVYYCIVNRGDGLETR
jgi:hypothetical protein